MKKIYIVLSKTPTNIGKIIRIFSNSYYNHAAISLDKKLTQIYAIARPMYRTPFLAKLVEESFTTYTLNRDEEVPIAIYEIELSKKQHAYVVKRIKDVMKDPEIIYNIISAMSFPFSKGMATYKSFTCSEFVMTLLKELDFELDKPSYQYLPDEMADFLKDYLIFKGDIREVMVNQEIDISYFNKVPYKSYIKNYSRVYESIKRKILY